MSDVALEAEVTRLRDEVAALKAARPADIEGFRQLNDAIVENRLGAFVREKAQPRWVTWTIGIIAAAPVSYFAIALILSRLLK
ncbi:MAG: hypothetical protein ACRYG4_26050 [Janthinobacterium lividum]